MDSPAIFFIIALFLIVFGLGSESHSGIVKVGWKEDGVSSYYAPSFNGRKTATGERYHHRGISAAHRTLPLGTKLLVTDKDTGKSLVVRVNDRGPYVRNRILDLSGGAADRLGIKKQGLCSIEIKVLSLPDKPHPRHKMESRGDVLERFIAREHYY